MLPLTRYRELLGEKANGMSDAELEELRLRIRGAAVVALEVAEKLYPTLKQQQARRQGAAN